MTIQHKTMNDAASDLRLVKRPYSAPALLVFGQVATLTRSQSGCFQSDSASCAVNTAGGMGVKASASDKTAKENIIRIGDHPLGFGLYLFDYKAKHRQQWGQGRQFGVMAQEVEALMPEAVCVHPDGYKMVNYAMLGITQTVH